MSECYDCSTNQCDCAAKMAAKLAALRAELAIEQTASAMNAAEAARLAYEVAALSAELERVRPVVDAACDYMDTVERYDTNGIHRTGKGSRARIRQAVDAYRNAHTDSEERSHE